MASENPPDAASKVPDDQQQNWTDSRNARSNPVPSEDQCLFMSSVTWARDSHELFDYEACHVHKKFYELKRAAKVFRTTLDVHVILDGELLPSHNADFLLYIKEKEGRFSVFPADRNCQHPSSLMPKKLWLIVKDLPNATHQLQEGDVIKLGRYKLKVKQMVKSDCLAPELRLDDGDVPASVVTPLELASMQCRICLLDGGTAEDPLLCPCQCRGSIKFVHLECLRRWINGRLSLTEEQKPSFFFKQLHCELCKNAFPSAVVIDGARVPIVRVPRVEPPFIVLESVATASNKGIYVVSMSLKKELKLGRGHESDVRIPDVSISRYHATIRFLDGEFVLEDHNSKFGTLVSLRKNQPVEDNHPLAVQVGRTVLNLSIRKPSCPFDGVNDVSEESREDVAPREGSAGADVATNSRVSNGPQSTGNASSCAEPAATAERGRRHFQFANRFNFSIPDERVSNADDRDNDEAVIGRDDFPQPIIIRLCPGEELIEEPGPIFLI